MMHVLSSIVSAALLDADTSNQLHGSNCPPCPLGWNTGNDHRRGR